MTNKHQTTLYIGVTNDLCRRVYEHKNHLVKGSFTDRYNLENCIYYEEFPYFDLAIQREKELKKWNRQKKEDLINKKNPDWKILVTEHGFIRENKPFSEQVAALLKEVQENTDTSPVGQNKNALKDGEITPHSQNKDAVRDGEIPPAGQNIDALRDCEIPPHSHNKNTLKEYEIPPAGRNDGATGGVIGENTHSLIKAACHSERSEETPFTRNLGHSERSEETLPRKRNL